MSFAITHVSSLKNQSGDFVITAISSIARDPIFFHAETLASASINYAAVVHR